MDKKVSFAFVFFLHKKHCLSLAKVDGGEMTVIYGEGRGKRHKDIEITYYKDKGKSIAGFGQHFVVYVVLAYSWE